MGIHHGVSKKEEPDIRISRSIESFLSVSNEKVDWGEAVEKKRKEADLDGEVENEMKKITYYFYCIHSDCTVCFITRRFPLLCIKRDAPCQLQINCQSHFLNFPTVSPLLHIRKILVHWHFLEISGPKKWVVALKEKFLAGTLETTSNKLHFSGC